MSMLRLIPHMAKIGVETEIRPFVGASLLSAARQKALDSAIEEGFSHILYIDDDIAFDTKAVDFLISRDKDFVCANYVTKGEGSRPVTSGLDGKFIYSHGKTGIEKIYQSGFGFVLIRTAAIKNIPKPYFEVPWVSDQNAFLGEDAYACRLFGHHGIELYVDHDASKYIAHMGPFPFRENYDKNKPEYTLSPDDNPTDSGTAPTKTETAS